MEDMLNLFGGYYNLSLFILYPNVAENPQIHLWGVSTATTQEAVEIYNSCLADVAEKIVKAKQKEVKD